MTLTKIFRVSLKWNRNYWYQRTRSKSLCYQIDKNFLYRMFILVSKFSFFRHLRWSVLQKYWAAKPLTIFLESSILNVWLVSEYASSALNWIELIKLNKITEILWQRDLPTSPDFVGNLCDWSSNVMKMWKISECIHFTKNEVFH